MKITYENQWERATLHVDLEIPYRENYQMQMLDKNTVSSLLKITGRGWDGKSRYSFHTKGFISMEKEYARKEMKKEDVEQFTEQLRAAVAEIRDYLLDPDQILLLPEFIFLKDGRYRFCYLPQTDLEGKKSLCVSFHELTEYFIKKLDHRDTEGIFLIYKLHKETFRDSYDLGGILEEYREEASIRREKGQKKKVEVRRGKEEYKDMTGEGEEGEEGEEGNSALSECAVFYAVEEEQEDDISKEPRDKHEIGQKKKQKNGRIKSIVQRVRTGRWGRWEDLITEMDGQRPNRHL